MLLEVDTSPGRHDTLIAACDVHRYALLGCNTYHDNCTDNLHAALLQIGLQVDECPSPLNLWMIIPITDAGSTGWGTPLSQPGDYVILYYDGLCCGHVNVRTRHGANKWYRLYRQRGSIRSIRKM